MTKNTTRNKAYFKIGFSMFWLLGRSFTRDDKMRADVFQLARSLMFYNDLLSDKPEFAKEELSGFKALFRSFLNEKKTMKEDEFSEEENRMVEILSNFNQSIKNHSYEYSS